MILQEDDPEVTDLKVTPGNILEECGSKHEKGQRSVQKVLSSLLRFNLGLSPAQDLPTKNV